MHIGAIRASTWALVPGMALALSVETIAAVVIPPDDLHGRGISQSGQVPGSITDHVIVISIDGLRPDAIEKFGALTLQRLMREGSYTLQAKTIMPSKTLPSHASMLTGEEPSKHGITWNSNKMDQHGHVAIPTVFAEARTTGLRTAAFFSKGKFNHLAVPNTLDHVRVPNGGNKWNVDQTVEHVGAYLEHERPNLMFVHISEPDHAGHRFSWMSAVYGRAVRKADRAVAQVLETADRAFGQGNYSVIITADHGGHGWSHGSSDLRDVTIPWIAWGQGVRAGTVLPDGIRTMDTAATALWLLGVPESAVGEPVRLAFSGAAAAPLPVPSAAGATVDPTN